RGDRRRRGHRPAQRQLVRGAHRVCRHRSGDGHPRDSVDLGRALPRADRRPREESRRRGGLHGARPRHPPSGYSRLERMEPFRPSDFTILVIDDEPDILELVVYNLHQEGYRVLQARTGEGGLELARRERPSLIVRDVMVPDLPGVEICRSLRANAVTARIPIIMLTARSSEVDRVSGFESGADDYVTKPFSVRELALRVRARLRAQPEAGTDSGATP